MKPKILLGKWMGDCPSCWNHFLHSLDPHLSDQTGKVTFKVLNSYLVEHGAKIHNKRNGMYRVSFESEEALIMFILKWS